MPRKPSNKTVSRVAGGKKQPAADKCFVCGWARDDDQRNTICNFCHNVMDRKKRRSKADVMADPEWKEECKRLSLQDRSRKLAKENGDADALAEHIARHLMKMGE
mmetsp:Transcript_32988/g.60653  ORF Transcript_32988/g.60653 Transcript_32988/m.60653 type:complete len:105 (-) Transcript_32988:67-381(-)